jgi:hypothetical protein
VKHSTKVGILCLVMLAIATVYVTSSFAKPPKKKYRTFNNVQACTISITKESVTYNDAYPLQPVWIAKATLNCGNGNTTACERVMCRFILAESNGDGTFTIILSSGWMIVDVMKCGQQTPVVLNVPHSYGPGLFRVQWEGDIAIPPYWDRGTQLWWDRKDILVQ